MITGAGLDVASSHPLQTTCFGPIPNRYGKQILIDRHLNRLDLGSVTLKMHSYET